MPGKSLEDKTKSQKQEIAEKKKAFLAYFGAWPVKKAAAEAVNRSVDTIDIWLKDDADFSEKYLSARAEWAKRKSGRLSPDHLLANMYPEELKPPKQEADITHHGSIAFTYVVPTDPPDSTNPDAQAAPSLDATPQPDHD